MDLPQGWVQIGFNAEENKAAGCWSGGDYPANDIQFLGQVAPFEQKENDDAKNYSK